MDVVNHLLQNLFVIDNTLSYDIDKIIDEYDKFIALLSMCITEQHLNNNFTLKEILGKSLRLIRPNDIKVFEEKLINEISSSIINFMVLIPNSKPTRYKIVEIPLKLNWSEI